jgi:hypothetical protein
VVLLAGTCFIVEIFLKYPVLTKRRIQEAKPLTLFVCLILTDCLLVKCLKLSPLIKRNRLCMYCALE